MTEQRYVEVDPTWVAHQWDGEFNDAKAFVVNWGTELRADCWEIASFLKIMYSVKFSGMPIPSSFEVRLGDWIMYSPELNTFQTVTNSQFHRKFTAKL